MSNLVGQKPPKSRNTRLMQALVRLQFKARTEGANTSAKKQAAARARTRIIASDPELQELIALIRRVQAHFNYTDEQFAARLGVSKRMIQYYKSGTMYMPSSRTLNKIFYLDKLANTKVTFHKRELTLVVHRPIHTIFID